MAVDHTVLVTAPGGNTGSDLVPRLLSSDKAKVVLLTSNAERLKSTVPTVADSPNAVVEQGSVNDPVWIESLLRQYNVDAVYLCLVGVDELLVALNFLHAMRRAGRVQHLVYLSANPVKNVYANCLAMHVIVRPVIETQLLHGNFGWTTSILRPTLFFTNDFRSKKAMLEEGLFDEPLGEMGVSRSSTSDVALAASNLILGGPEHPHAGKRVQIGSLKTYKGSETATLWSRALGKEIRALKSDEKGFAELEKRFAAKGLPPELRRSVRLMYETYVDVEFGMSEQEWRLQREVLGKEPESYEEWVAKTGEEWREE